MQGSQTGCLVDPFVLKAAAAHVLDTPATDDLDDCTERDLARLRSYFTERLRDARASLALH